MYVCSLSLFLTRTSLTRIPRCFPLAQWSHQPRSKQSWGNSIKEAMVVPTHPLQFDLIQFKGWWRRKGGRRSPPLDHPMNGNERELMCAWRHVRPCQQQPPWLRFPDPNKENTSSLLILLRSPFLPYFLLALLTGSLWVYVFNQLESRVEVG